jgi:lipid-binding SYLF domain-containing protein
MSLEGSVISIRESCNRDFYKKEVTAKEILNGDVGECAS